MMNRVEGAIKHTLQCLVSVFIALEVAIPPNPYKTHLITILVLLIAHKYDVPGRMTDIWERLWHSKG
mgnify:CR=1|tara:strand:- start:92 stop:292 length:201 start_codon:yes stop_codon:yes gene_type:complete